MINHSPALQHLTIAQWTVIDRLSSLRYAPTLARQYTNGTVRVLIARKLEPRGRMTIEVTADGLIRHCNTRTRHYNTW